MTLKPSTSGGLELHSLGRGVLDELDTLLDVALEALVALLQQLLLVLVGATKDVLCVLGAVRVELDRNGEVVAAGQLGDFITAGDAGQVDVGWLNDAGLALESPDDLLGEAGPCY